MNTDEPVTRAEFEELAAAVKRLDTKVTSQIAEMESHLCRLEKDMRKMFGIKHYVDIGISVVAGGGVVYSLLAILHLLK